MPGFFCDDIASVLHRTADSAARRWNKYIARNLVSRAGGKAWRAEPVLREQENCDVKKMNEYLEHAAECREMARTALPAQRVQLEHMALTWEQLAAARKRFLEKDGKADGKHGLPEITD